MTKLDTKIPTSAKEWRLYSNMKGAGGAAKELTSALRLVLKDIRAGRAVNAKDIGNSVNTHLYPLMRKHAEFGALDIGPRYVARISIVRAWCNKTGSDLDCFGAYNLADDIL